jgi:hypothetical protein
LNSDRFFRTYTYNEVRIAVAFLPTAIFPKCETATEVNIGKKVENKLLFNAIA